MSKNGIVKHSCERNKEGIVNIAFTEDPISTKAGSADGNTLEIGKVSRRSSVVVEGVSAAAGQKSSDEIPIYRTQVREDLLVLS